ncbi:50S ribosomal protein L17,50S ribosomal protein L17,Ribosomal protein L17,ribosomal protein L17,Ribosomal protein L17 [Chlamydia serpentis]|uniref:Large ribosomal subunit protein bL17 n=1 Tax=Chlamydia serpentis TaxID=1967782 RepID=A0A2R8FBE8_9CHLA|nr:50S ribosomal protein L17 [Chlamydia serpentis]SPN73745.1 50S ribosomal protein L17,50S ribosomal protein L17,Ribosomal protein L17,ribosomal protein L17,Ribosomal protein L17 [Chlamydia serpentis]
MQHARKKFRVGRTSSHNRCMLANMLKSLIHYERIETTLPKAKELRRHADKMITLAKKNSLAARRIAIGRLMVRYNKLTSKEARQAKSGNTSVYNVDRLVVNKLFDELGNRFVERKGGYTRILKLQNRIGDNAQKCIIEFLAN